MLMVKKGARLLGIMHLMVIKNVSMELYSKTKIAALYLMCTHFILAICLK